MRSFPSIGMRQAPKPKGPVSLTVRLTVWIFSGGMLSALVASTIGLKCFMRIARLGSSGDIMPAHRYVRMAL